MDLNCELVSLVKSNKGLILPSFKKLIVNYENNTYNFHENFTDFVSVSDSILDNQSSVLNKISISFKLLDRILDKENENLSGMPYWKKHEQLKKGTDFEKIFSEIYRILRVFRNAEVHDPNSIVVDNKNICVRRKDKKGEEINIIGGIKLIDLLFSYGVYYNNLTYIDINLFYKNQIALWYYSEIKKAISIMPGKNIPFSNENVIISYIENRYICDNIKYNNENEYIIFCIKPDYLYSKSHENNRIDFVFSFSNKYYMIPYEVVKEGKIELTHLQQFEISGDITPYLKIFYNKLINRNNIVIQGNGT